MLENTAAVRAKLAHPEAVQYTDTFCIPNLLPETAILSGVYESAISYSITFYHKQEMVQ